MSIDLERSLTDLARSVHDDAVAERMSGRVRHMVTRIRRRRAARYSATGVIGVGAAAAVVVGGLQLADRYPSTVPPAATDQTVPPAAVDCGLPVPDPLVTSDGTFTLVGTAGPSAPYGEPVPVALTLISANAQTFSEGETVQIFVLADGVLVGTGRGDSVDLGVVEGVDATPGAAVAVTPCDGDAPLDLGGYELVALVTVELSDGTSRTVTSDRLPFAITDAPADDAEAALQAIIAAAPVDEPFPACGSLVPAPADDPILTLGLLLSPEGPYYSGALSTDAILSTTGGRGVIANAPTSALIVLTRDGVVVGRGYWESDVDILGIEPGGELSIPAIGQFDLCTIPMVEGPQEPLPGGTYSAYAVLEVALKEVHLSDGSAESRSDLVVVRSDPVEIEISVG